MKSASNILLALALTFTPSFAQDADADKVGFEGELSSLDGGLGGTVVVVDSETIRIDNYELEEASAPALYWWGSESEELSEGFRIVSQQVTEAADTDTLTLGLDEGFTTADFVTFGLWCERFDTSFGETMLEAASGDGDQEEEMEEDGEGAGSKLGLGLTGALAASVAAAFCLI